MLVVLLLSITLTRFSLPHPMFTHAALWCARRHDASLAPTIDPDATCRVSSCVNSILSAPNPTHACAYIPSRRHTAAVVEAANTRNTECKEQAGTVRVYASPTHYTPTSCYRAGTPSRRDRAGVPAFARPCPSRRVAAVSIRPLTLSLPSSHPHPLSVFPSPFSSRTPSFPLPPWPPSLSPLMYTAAQRVRGAWH
ncbi:hypothetical protein B0H16DRAFT_1901812 [Mycena metata]|uniref:Secreted protein n=1 Tax=Mycena metata TaxID=1033252 RepID=A0AAD7GUT6_9AGAR|nr:hypothetical protein B0H16DRAFT_1901812 [Mycena metata]